MSAVVDLPWGLQADLPPGVEAEYSHASSILSVSFRNGDMVPARPGAVVLEFPVGRSATGGWAWVHGRYMQRDAFVRVFGDPALEGYSGTAQHTGAGEVRYVSEDVALIALPTEVLPVVAVGALDLHRVFTSVEIVLDADEATIRALRLVFDLEALEVAPGESFALPDVLVASGPDPLALIEHYADLAGRRAGARLAHRVPTGWCSWYQFGNAVSEMDVVRNLEALRGGGEPVDVVQVDDGYQSATGDWLVPGERFPSGMASLAARIRNAGYRPGIWLAPLVLHESSRTLAEHPEFALRRADGELLFVETWLGRCAVLDATHPGARDWLQAVVRAVVSEWGYEYLKLDALAYAAQSSRDVRYHAAGTSAPGHLRAALRAIREAAGDETFLLGCTAHFGPAIGIVDAMRVGPDVSAEWGGTPVPSVRHALRMALQRNWMHGRWWINDPDCLLARDTDTGLTEAEVRFLAAGIGVSGGMVVLGDDLANVGPARRSLARSLLPPPGAAGRPVHPADGPVPSVWRASLENGRTLLGILNWSDAPRWVVVAEMLRPGEVAFDPWSGRVLGHGDVPLDPHEGALWQVSLPGAGPRCVGDTGHVGFAGLFERRVSGRLQLRNDGPRARTVAVEARGRLFTAELDPGEMRWFD